MPYKKLVRGFEKFREDYFSNKESELFQDLAENGQHPETLVIACSDSRIDPALLTSSEPGEFFAIRNVAALVPPYHCGSNLQGTSSAIEYAVRHLKVKHIVVLGHAQCGGVNALVTNNYQASTNHDFEFLENWLNIGKETKEDVYSQLTCENDPAKTRALEQALILTSIKNLISFPWIRTKFESGEIKIHGWYFDLVNGELMEYSTDKGVFEALTGDNATNGVVDIPSLSHFLKHYPKALSCGCNA